MPDIKTRVVVRTYRSYIAKHDADIISLQLTQMLVVQRRDKNAVAAIYRSLSIMIKKQINAMN
ncbi:MAG: hypothetical protein WBP45_04590 [Daejeonella sp.]